MISDHRNTGGGAEMGEPVGTATPLLPMLMLMLTLLDPCVQGLEWNPLTTWVSEWVEGFFHSALANVFTLQAVMVGS